MAADKRFISPGLDSALPQQGASPGAQRDEGGAGSRRSSDPAKIEQIHLGVYGETDSLEQALVAEEVHPGWPLRAHEDGRLDVERLAFQRGDEERSSVQRSPKGAEPGAEADLLGDLVEALANKIADGRLEDTPRGGCVHDGKHRSLEPSGLDLKIDQGSRCGEISFAIGVLRHTRCERSPHPSGQNRAFSQSNGREGGTADFSS